MARRGRNEGSIYKRDDGRWTAVVDYGYEGGKRKRKHLYGATRAAVSRKLTAALKAKQDGVPVLNERLTLGEYLHTWMQFAKSSLRASTAGNYETNIRVHIIPALGRVPLARLTPAAVQAFLTSELDPDRKPRLSPRTVQYERAILRRALEKALQWGLVSRNVVKLTDSPRVERLDVQALSPDQARCLIEAVRGHRLGSLFVLALATGLRQGELLGLKWSDVDLETAVLRVSGQLQRTKKEGGIGSELKVVPTKTARSRRIINLPPIALDALRDRRVQQLEDRLFAAKRWTEQGFVFTTPLGTPFDGSTITHRFQEALSVAGLPKMRFHDLRHGAASLLLAQGVDIRTLMEILGHSQISLTMNTYAHVIPALREDAADRMQAALTGTA